VRPTRHRPEGELIALGDLDGIGLVSGLPVRNLTASGIKNAHELRDLRRVCGNALRSALHGLWKVLSGG
jgi:hypothetical protein